MFKLSMLLFIFMMFMMLYGLVECGINWGLNLQVGSNGEYKRPNNMAENDYVDYKQLKHLGDEVIMNHSRMKEIKRQLEANTFQDQMVKYTGLVVVVFTTIGAMLNRIQQVKKLTRSQPAQENVMMAPARLQPDIFGRASF